MGRDWMAVPTERYRALQRGRSRAVRRSADDRSFERFSSPATDDSGVGALPRWLGLTICRSYCVIR